MSPSIPCFLLGGKKPSGDIVWNQTDRFSTLLVQKVFAVLNPKYPRCCLKTFYSPINTLSRFAITLFMHGFIKPSKQKLAFNAARFCATALYKSLYLWKHSISCLDLNIFPVKSYMKFMHCYENIIYCRQMAPQWFFFTKYCISNPII